MTPNEAVKEIWSEWFQFYQKHFREGKGNPISAADQMAFYEIAQPILNKLAVPPASGSPAGVPEGKQAPVQGFSAGIPWSMHLRAYDAYCKAHGPQPAMIDLEGRNCRGGFGVSELDMFIPGWRDELSELNHWKARAESAEAVLAAAPSPPVPAQGVEAMRAVLRQHWLVDIDCDHESKTDTAHCYCTVWKSGPMPSVYDAVSAWIDHVVDALSRHAPVPGQVGEDRTAVTLDQKT